MSRKLFFRGIVLLVIIGAVWRFFQNRPEEQLVYVTGQTMGTITYNVKYLSKDGENLKEEIDSVLVAFNQSLSTYIPNSEISLLNRTGRLFQPSDMFLDVMKSSSEVFEATGGAFDPTVGRLVNAWGFGPDKIMKVPDSSVIDSLKNHIGFDQVMLSNDTVYMPYGMYLDFSAIAKGYAVDLVADLLKANDLENFMVEIGGEVVANGVNAEGEIWKIGIEDPLVSKEERKLLAIVKLKGLGMATSGNYRNYYTVGSRTIAHTIDPRTGYNTNHTLLSASVFARDCMTADAYATAFMVLGLEESRKIAESEHLDAFLIYQDEAGALKSYVSSGLQPLVELNNTEK